MKTAFNVHVWNYSNFVILTWQDYNFATYRIEAKTEEEAKNKLTAEGWEIDPVPYGYSAKYEDVSWY